MSEEIEAFLLTGGASRRMGRDKASLLVDGAVLAERIARSLSDYGIKVTVVGRSPLPGYDFIRDEVEFGGPLLAVAGIAAARPFAVLVACDLPEFDARIVNLLRTKLGDSDAAVPDVAGRLQPLCALYRSSALEEARLLAKAGEQAIIAWLHRLDVTRVTEEDLRAAGIAPSTVRGVNTPEELRRSLEAPE